MNQQRTFGIEIECYANITKAELSAKIQEALRAVGLQHECFPSYYHHNTDSANVTVWEVKNDGSLDLCPRGYTNPVEIVSPVLHGDEGLKAVKAVCEAIADFVKVNRTCGLHVHHGLNVPELRKLVTRWLAVERFFMQVLPPSRHNNGYCRTWQFYNATAPGAREDLTRWFSRTMGTRYTTLNLESFSMRNTAEFRLHSGTSEYEKIANWIVATQRLIEFDGELNVGSFDEMIDRLFRGTVTTISRETVRTLADTPIGKIVMNDISNGHAYLLFDLVNEDGETVLTGEIEQQRDNPTLHDLIVRDNTQTVLWSADSEFYDGDVTDNWCAGSKLRMLMREKLAELSGCEIRARQITQIRRARKERISLQVGTQTVTETVTSPVDEKVSQAGDWMVARRAVFAV